ncbi:MAG: response regulator [Lachnospiraceae bacterium]|nr:response regulator [Lachnospiraceae bacterium]
MMTNAIKYTDAGGTAVLLVSGQFMDDDHVRLHMGVKDNGKGIKKEDIDKLFNAFQRVDETSNQAIEGTGLGLSISRSYIRMMDGELQVESEYGKGSYFHFDIPQQVRGNEIIGEFEQRYGGHPAEAGAYRRNFAAPDAKILVVDDDEMNRAVVKGLLKQTKVQMDFAESGEQCLERMADCHYDVILLDHMMPGMDGMETLAEMKKRYPNERAKVIVLTANAISGMRQMYLDSGFDDYMTKPIDGGTLEKMLMNYIPEEKIDRAAVEEKEQTVTESGANQKKKAASDQGGNGSLSLGELQEWKTAVPELDVLLGLEYSIGDKKFYTEMLRMFAEQSKIPMLNEHYGHADWGQYHTLVHALKSTALSIGLVRLSEQARQLEYAAKRSDAAYITAFHSEVMEYYGDCIRQIQQQLAGNNGEG